jgi:O-antigen/teichoic acid export membrane protein
MLPEEDEEAAGVLTLALVVTTGVALLTALGLLGLPLWADLLGGPAMRPALLLLPPAVALAGWSAAFETWHTRCHRFQPVATGRALQSGSAVALQLTAGFAGVGAVGLVAGAAAGFVATAFWLSITLLVSDWKRLRVRLRALPKLARRYARFPLLSAPAALLNVLASRAPVLLLAAFFTAGTVGQFGIAFGTLVLPLGLLTGAVGQVFFVRAAEAHRAGTLGPLTLGVFRQLLVMTVYPALVVAVAGPALFAFVFGPEWAVAGVYARALSAWVLLVSVAVPLTRVFDVTEQQRADLGFSLALFAVQTGAFAAAAVLGSALDAVITLGAVGAGMRLLHIGWMLRLAGTPLQPAAFAVLRVGAYALPFLLLVAAVQAWTGSGLSVLLAAVVGGLGYVGLAAQRGMLREPV